MTSSRRRALSVLVAALAGAALLTGCGGDGDTGAATTAASAPASAPATTATAPVAAVPAADLERLRGDLAQPIAPAPALRLRDAGGRPVDLRELRGAPAVITFVYANCVDVCPLVLQNLSRARRQLRSDDVDLNVVAVSVDPVGDTPAAVRRFLRSRGLAKDVTYLVGDRTQLRRTWRAWGVGADVDLANPALVEHSALVYGIGASGKLITRYPVDVPAATVVRDARILARA